MNNVRRKAIDDLVQRMGSRGGLDDLGGLADDAQALLDEEQEYLDNMPENMQMGERYAMAEQAVEQLTYAVEALNQMQDSFDEAVAGLQSAQA